MSEVETPTGVLNVVATPLGNLGDLSERAVQILRGADRVYAEDTRRTRVLLSHIGSTAPIKSLHEHNEKAREAEVLRALEEGLRIALVSDAGTPAVSDPGADLVAAVGRAGFRVVPVPGPCAFAAALSVAGFRESSRDVRFVGFLPPKGSARKECLENLATQFGLGVFYESPKRIRKTLAQLCELAPNRPAVICRELTKVHEEIVRGSVAELVNWATQREEIRGEITVVIGPNEGAGKPVELGERELDEALRSVLDAGLSPRDAAAAVSILLGLKKRKVYNRLNELAQES